MSHKDREDSTMKELTQSERRFISVTTKTVHNDDNNSIHGVILVGLNTVVVVVVVILLLLLMFAAPDICM